MSKKISPFWYNKSGLQTTNKNQKEEFIIKDKNSLAHSEWNFKYH